MSRKKSDAAQSSPPAPAPATELNLPEIAPLQEYDYHGEKWRCERYDLLLAEFALKGEPAEQIPLLQETAMQFTRGWLITRRLYGMGPVVPSMDISEDDLKVWKRTELEKELGLSKSEIQAELDAIRGTYNTIRREQERQSRESGGELPDEVKKRWSPDKDLFEDIKSNPILLQYGFDMKWHDAAEMEWFAERVKSFSKVLDEAFSQGLARSILGVELQKRRVEYNLNQTKRAAVGGPEYKGLHNLKGDLDKAYQSLLKQLEDSCPWASAVAGKYTFAGVVSDITRAMQEYYSNGDNRLVDGIFTATEIQVELRRSTQMPDPRYRAGLVVFLNAAKAGLWDPNWKPSLEQPVLRKMDEAWKAAARAIGEASGEQVPDLASDTPDDEYDDLKLPSELNNLPL